LAFVSASVCQVFNFNCENESEKQKKSDECNCEARKKNALLVFTAHAQSIYGQNAASLTQVKHLQLVVGERETEREREGGRRRSCCTFGCHA